MVPIFFSLLIDWNFSFGSHHWQGEKFLSDASLLLTPVWKLLVSILASRWDPLQKMGPSRGWKPWAVNRIQLLISQPALILLRSFPDHFYLQQMKVWGKDAGQWLVGAVVDQSFSSVWLFVTPWTAACQASWSFIMSRSWLRLMSIESVIPSNHPILCCPFSSCPQAFPRSQFFSSESTLRIRWPKYSSFSISPSIEYSGLISVRIDWFDLLAVQQTWVFSSTTIWKYQFFSTQLSLWSNSHIHTWLAEKP